MKSLFTYLSFLLFACFALAELAAPLEPVSPELVVRDDNGAIEIAEYLQQLVIASGLTPQNLSKRDYPDSPALTAAFTALNKSGQGVTLIHGLATNGLSQDGTVDIVNSYIKNTGLTKILSAANKSGLAVSIVMRFFINYSLVPGLWNVIVSLWNNGTISIGKRWIISDLIGTVINGVQDTILSSLISLINAVTDLAQICSSLNKSGLAVSILDDLVSTTDGQGFIVKVVTTGVKTGTLSFGILLDGLKDSGVLVDTFSTIIGNSTYRKIIFIWAVKNLVSFIKYIF
ncbi:hypothetical protein Cantr_02580 [Candida viswanathii]|uniref:Uncharacterized protein n=1 Tax=Candida viswanathii TaxID=5486 RepID=A0A367YRG9_9ASCO|nr:hypothetical protein Cantr_02580 [Candida viswanathii]